MVELALRVEKLIDERISCSNFQKRKGFNFVFGQSSKKKRSSDSLGNSSSSGSNSINFHQSFRYPQPSKLGMLPPDSAFRGRPM